MKLSHALGAISALILAPTAARAGGYTTARYGADFGSPAYANSFAVYYNPAALGPTRGTTLAGDVGLALRVATYERTPDALSPSDPAFVSDPYTRSNTGKATLTNFAPLPYVSVTTDFGKKLAGLRAGYAFYIPYGGQADWDRSKDSALIAMVPGAKDGAQRWHNISGQILAVYNTVALAYELPFGFSIGASVSPVLNWVKTVRARNLDGSDNTFGPNGKLIEGRSYIDVKGVNLAAGVGLHWDPLPDHSLKLGVSYASQPGFGETRMSGDLIQQLGSSPPGDATKVDLLQSWPDMIRFGFSWQMSKQWELHSDFAYERWSVFKYQCLVVAGAKCDVNDVTGADNTNGKIILNIPTRFKDAISTRLGVMWSPIDDLTAFASTGFGTSAVPNQTINAAAIDAFNVYATAGARVALGKKLAIGASYNHVFYLDVDTKGQSALYGYQEPSRSPSANGKYTQTVGFLDANIAYTF